MVAKTTSRRDYYELLCPAECAIADAITSIGNLEKGSKTRDTRLSEAQYHMEMAKAILGGYFDDRIAAP